MFRAPKALLLLLLVMLGAGFLLWPPDSREPIRPAPLVPGATRVAAGEVAGDSSFKAEESDLGDATFLGDSSARRQSEGDSKRWIRGSLRSSRTHLPIPDGIVSLRGENGRKGQAQSDGQGTFALEWLGSGTVSLSLEAPDFERRKHPGLEFTDEPLELEMVPLGMVRVTFERPTGILEGPFGEVHFYQGPLSFAERKPHLSLTLDETLKFGSQLPEGMWSLALHRVGQSSSYESGFQIHSGEETHLHLPLSPGLMYRGKVVMKHTHEPVPEVTLNLREEPQGVSRTVRRSRELTTVSDGEGEFWFENLRPGKVTISLLTPWGQPLSWNHVLSTQSSGKNERVVVAPPGRIGGIVRSQDGHPLAQQAVAIIPASHLRGSGLETPAEELGTSSVNRAMVRRTFTDEKGSFQFDEVPANRSLYIQVRSRSQLLGEVTVMVPERGALDNVLITMPGSASFRVRVQDPQGQPIEGVQVTLKGPDEARGAGTGISPRARTDKGGLAQFSSVSNQWFYAELMPDGGKRSVVDLVPEGLVVATVEPPGLVRGFVRDEDGWEVAGLLISALGVDHRIQTLSDRKGAFEFRSSEFGTLTLRAAGSAWETVDAAQVTLQPGQTSEVLLIVRRVERADPGSLLVEAAARGSGNPVSGLSVIGLGDCTVSLRETELLVTGIHPRRYSPTLRAPGFENLRLPALVIIGGETTDLGRVEMRPATKLLVLVQDAEGNGIKGARVLLTEITSKERARPKGGRWELRADARGRAVFEKLPRKRLLLTITSRSFKKHSQKVRGIKPSQTLRVRLTPRDQ